MAFLCPLSRGLRASLIRRSRSPKLIGPAPRRRANRPGYAVRLYMDDTNGDPYVTLGVAPDASEEELRGRTDRARDALLGRTPASSRQATRGSARRVGWVMYLCPTGSSSGTRQRREATRDAQS